jgi:D-aminopeptidase
MLKCSPVCGGRSADILTPKKLDSLLARPTLSLFNAAIAVLLFVIVCHGEPPRPRARELGIAPGKLATGPLNSITDIAGVTVGHATLVDGKSIVTGATAIVPHLGNLFQDKVPAAVVVGNGFGKLVGSTQIEELGELETPILLTNTLNVWEAAAALADYTLAMPGNEAVRSVNPLVGETNDGWLNDIRQRPLQAKHFREALRAAASGPVAEGCVGAGAGTKNFGFKGGIGTSSRQIDDPDSPFRVGVLVQTNYDGRLTVDGVPVWRELKPAPVLGDKSTTRHGSCMIVVATDAPLDARQLKRLARRALAGMARTGANFSNGSGDYVIAFSTAKSLRISYNPSAATGARIVLNDVKITPLFEAVADATEEAIYNALLRAVTTRGRDGHVAEAIPIDQLKRVLAKYGHGGTAAK